MCIGSCVVSGAMMCGVCCASCGQGAVIEGGGKSWHHANHAIKDETCQRCHSSCLSVVAAVALIERKNFLDSLVSFKFFLFHGIFLCFCRALSHTIPFKIAKKCYACPWYPSASCGMRAQSLGGPDPKARSCERCLCWSALVSKEPNHLSFQRYFMFFVFFFRIEICWNALRFFGACLVSLVVFQSLQSCLDHPRTSSTLATLEPSLGCWIVCSTLVSSFPITGFLFLHL